MFCLCRAWEKWDGRKCAGESHRASSNAAISWKSTAPPPVTRWLPPNHFAPFSFIRSCCCMHLEITPLPPLTENQLLWRRLKAQYGCESPSMDKLLDEYIGLDEVKEKVGVPLRSPFFLPPPPLHHKNRSSSYTNRSSSTKASATPKRCL